MGRRFGLVALVWWAACSSGRADLPAWKGQHNGPVLAVRFTPDGQTIWTVATDQTARSWAAGTGAPRKTLEVLVARAAAVSADGKLIAVGSGSFAHIYDTATGKTDAPLNVWNAGINFLSFAGPKKLIAHANHVFYFNLDNRQNPLNIISSGDDGPVAVAATREGKLVAIAPPDEPIRVFDEGSRDLSNFGGKVRGARALAFAPDQQTLAAGLADRSLRLLKGGQTAGRLPTLPEVASCLMFNATGATLAVGGTGGTVYLIDAATAKEVRRYTGHRGAITALAFSPDGTQFASGSADGTVRVWDTTPPTATTTPAANLDAAWTDLSAAEPARARAAFAAFASAPSAVPYLRDRLAKGATYNVTDDVRRRLRELDDDSFIVRRQAVEALRQLGPAGEAALRAELAATSSPEVRRRLEALLAARRPPAMTDDHRRLIEAVELLQEIGTPAARQALEALTTERLAVPFAAEVAAALARLERRGKPAE